MSRFVWICCACFAVSTNACFGLMTVPLNGQWSVSNPDKTYTAGGQVPGSMYTALIANGTIGDPYYRKNDAVYAWIAEEDWTYTRTFTVDSQLLGQDSVVLVCEGLDTVSTVAINGQLVGTSDNMFVRYVYDIKDKLKIGTNAITVRFVSAVRYSREQAAAHAYPVPPVSVLATSHGQPHVNMIRKEQCSFSWDWGPSFPTQGIWYVGMCSRPRCPSSNGITSIPGMNTITAQFKSATEYVKTKAQIQGFQVLPLCVPPAYHGACGANLIRKMQCSFSWDWGPSFPTQGIWKDIYIQGYDSAAIRYVTSETARNADTSWKLTVEVFTEVKPGTTATGTMEVKLDGTSVTRRVPVSLTSLKNRTNIELDIPTTTAIGEWWPNGYGNQTLYDLYVFYTDQHGLMNTEKVTIGFRTVEIVEDYVSTNKSMGKTFYFRINGQPVFFKGSNWIPADSFQERVTREYVHHLLKSAADVHMNSMRVWGGGVYESDMFYEIADELGIMIWQDFMFACAMYPTDPAFLQTVSREVTHQVRRLKHHPSVIVLSGNNENEKALRQDWYGTNVNFTRYKADYVALYRDVIYDIVQKEDTSRPFLASSPSNGIKAPTEDWVAKDPGSSLYGDIHEYKYLVPFYDPSQYRVPRFSSEYGLQSYPSMTSLFSVYDNDDLYYWGDLNDWRNHHPFGNVELMAEAIQYVNLPNSPTKERQFGDLIYVTQITQSIGMKAETEHYRRWQNRLDAGGQGNTMGALYWMLADIWQAPTWASIEYGGKWKMLHYYANNFFAPTLISPYLDGDDVVVYIVVDELPVKEVRHPVEHTLSFKPKSNPRPFNMFDLSSYSVQTAGQPMVTATKTMSEFDGNLYIEMYSWNSMTVMYAWKIPFKIESTAESVFRENYQTMMSTAGCLRQQACFLVFHLGDKDSGPTNWLTFSQFNSADGLQKANITVKSVEATPKPDEFTVTIQTNATAPFVWLETYFKGRFSDNGFLLASPSRTLTFYAWEPVTLPQFTGSIAAKSLMDIYY